jgi:hypothetical protein
MRKGSHLSEETKKKLRLANIGKKHSEETKGRISSSNMGKHKPTGAKHSDESYCNNMWVVS